MLIEQNQVLSRIEPNGDGGTQFLYRVNQYGVAAVTSPQEDVSHIHWKVDVIKYHNNETLQYDLCHTTELADKTLTFRNDKSVNEFLEKAFEYFTELQKLENMLDK
jgi:3-dehydroquinate dehydratase